MPLDLDGVDAIIFDNNGTLFHTELISYPAVISAYEDLNKIYQVDVPILDKTLINQNIGLPAREYFKSLLPDEMDQWVDEFGELVVQHEVINIEKGIGKLYPGVKETLLELKMRNYCLGVITNAGSSYFSAVAVQFNYSDFFHEYRCLDQTHLTKSELFHELVSHFQAKKPVMVGDKYSDIKVAKMNNAIGIAVLYGYGTEEELSSADLKIKSLPELLKWLPKNASL